MSNRKIYLAGPYSSRELLVGYAAEAQQIGYELHARWLDGTHEVADEKKATDEERARWARDDLRDVSECDVVVAFTSAAAGGGGHSGGRHVETGYALARNVRVILVGEPENVFHSLPQIKHAATWHEATLILAAELVQHERDLPRSTVRAAS